MKPRIREIGSFVVVGVRQHFDRESKHHIPELWQRFVPLARRLPASPYEYAAGPDFEGYPAGFQPAPGHSFDIAVPIRPNG